MGTDRNGDTHPAPPLDLTEQDAESTKVDASVSNWDRIFRMLRAITNKVTDIDQTQIKQLEVAKESCRRLDAIEKTLKEMKP